MFAPVHLRRIKDAVQRLTPPPPKPSASVAASDVDDEAATEGNRSEFAVPSVSVSSATLRAIKQQEEQLAALTKQMEELKKAHRDQMEAEHKRSDRLLAQNDQLLALLTTLQGQENISKQGQARQATGGASSR